MKLRELHIHAMPGFERKGFALTELDAGLNVVLGPNGSGKTTTCRAIRGLIWPEALDRDRPVSIESIWDDRGEALRIERLAERTTYQRDGATVAAPPVPGPQLAECFTVTVDNLFDGSRTDRQLAEGVAREMAGGYDLGAVRQSALLKPRHGRAESEALRQAGQKVKEITARQEELREEEGTLADLERQEQAARTAAARLERLDTVRRFTRLKGELASLDAQLKTFSPAMDRLQGDEPARLEQLADDLAKAEDARRKAEEAIRESAGQIAAAGLPPAGVPQPLLDELDTRLERLADLERNIAVQQRALGAAEVKWEQALRVIGPAGTPEALENIDLAGLDQIDAFHREVEQLAAERRAAETQLNLLGPAAEPADMESLTAGLHLLRQWFEVGPPPRPADDPRRRLLVWLLIAGLAVLGIVLAAAVSAWWILLLVPAGAAAWFAQQPAPAPSADPRAFVREHFARLPFAPPEAWEQAAVGRRVNELERLLAEARAAEASEQQRRSLRVELERIERAKHAMDAKRQALLDRFGVAPEASSLAMVTLAGQLAAYQQARAAAREAADALARLRDDYAAELQAINRGLAPFGFAPAADLAEARPRKADLARRAAMHREAVAKRNDAESKEADAASRIVELQCRREQLFQAAGFDEPDEVELRRRVEQLPAYRAAVNERRTISAQSEGDRKQLDDEPELLDLTLDEVEHRAAELKQQAESYRGLVEQIQEIRRRIDEAGAGAALEEALAAVDRAAETLRERRGQAEQAAAAGFLLDDVEAEYRVESQPPVLRRAADWFTGFTRGRYELRVAESVGGDAPSFLALDTGSRRGQPLDQLSRGTRMQLLLAVRLAFAVQSEQGTSLPILLDEVLSSSDPERFAAIAECVLALVEQQRQVFYFTCQPSDAAAWREMARRRGMTLRRPIDLAALRGLPHGEVELLSASTVAVEPVPAPEGRCLADYAAALGVPPLDPAAGAGSAHLAHLLDSAEALHRLLRAGVTAYGSLRAMAAHGQVDALIDAAALARADARARALDAFAEAWQVGRGQRLSREVLVDAGVSEKFIDGLCSLAGDLDWDAARLIGALDDRDDDRTKGFQKRTRDRMVDHLTTTGHLDPNPPLDKPAVYARVLGRVGDDLKRGVLEIEEVAGMVERLWARAQSPATS